MPLSIGSMDSFQSPLDGNIQTTDENQNKSVIKMVYSDDQIQTAEVTSPQ